MPDITSLIVTIDALATGAAKRPCSLIVGTAVLTLDGEIPVEYINPGDRVISRDSGTATVAAVRTRTIRCDAVGVAAGSLGHMRPDSDMILPADQAVLIRDWRARALFGRDQALVPAQRLVDGEFVTDLGRRDLRVVELVFDAPHILYAGGLEVAGDGAPAHAAG